MVHPLLAVPHATRTEWPDLAVVDAAHSQPGVLRDALRWLKAGARLPLVVITAPEDVEHRLISITYRADDHCVDPVSTEELIARLDRLIGSREGRRRSRLGDMSLDTATNEVARRGQRIRLTPTEFKLLRRLAETPNEPVPVDALATAAGLRVNKRNTVQVHVSTLRRKLESSGPTLIHTANGRGYYLRPTPEIDVEQRAMMLARREALLKEREEAVARRTELLARMEEQRRRAR